MPLELENLDRGNARKPLMVGDRGFLLSMAKTKWSKHAGTEAVKLLKSFSRGYYNEKCPENKLSEIEESTADTDGKDNQEDADGKEKSAENKTEGPKIQFLQRDLMYNNCGFIATNLPDPADFACYLMNELADTKKDIRTKFPFRIMPVQAVCEARPKCVEKAAMPLIKSIFGADENYPYRFTLMFRGSNKGENLTQKEAKAVVRSCIWAINPNCVQCIKYQDYAIMIDIQAPLFCIGIAKDFQRLACYNTWNVRLGLDLTDQGPDSEDDISDDPNLDDEDNKRRKLRIKRKRRLEKAAEDEAKKRAEAEKDQPQNEEQNAHGENIEGDDGDENSM